MTSSESCAEAMPLSAGAPEQAAADSVPASPLAGAGRPGDGAGANPPLTVIAPAGRWRLPDVRELWAYRELVLMLALRDIKVRYKQTALGFTWAILQPVLMMGVFSIFFGALAKMPSDGLPYPVFVYAGLLPWTFFAGTLAGAGNSLAGSANLISKIYFPRLAIPLASAGSSLADFLVAGTVLLLLMACYGVGWSWTLLAVPVLTAGIAAAALGAGIFLSALNAAYRDFRYVIPFLVQFWMFATPVIYPASLVPEGWRWLYYLNPMAGLIEGFRSAFLGRAFDFGALALSLAAALILLLAGTTCFARLERRLADII